MLIVFIVSHFVLFTLHKPNKTTTRITRLLARLQHYLEGAVHKGFVQVDHHAALAVVCDVDLWQQELGWWLQRPKYAFLYSSSTSIFFTNTH